MRKILLSILFLPMVSQAGWFESKKEKLDRYEDCLDIQGSMSSHKKKYEKNKLQWELGSKELGEKSYISLVRDMAYVDKKTGKEIDYRKDVYIGKGHWIENYEFKISGDDAWQWLRTKRLAWQKNLSNLESYKKDFEVYECEDFDL